ncbi:MAG: sugar ABC transporter permease [Provencibacterium sp.]|jgi:putative aldouronate transport system permease protein|nr:sugar ABC transporter permease [Provencibacterium sp.]
MQKIKTFFCKYRYLHLMMLPCILFFLIFKYVPMYGLIIAFKDYEAVGGFWGILSAPFVGLQNFKRFFSSIYFGRLLRNTLLISTYRLIFSFPAPVIMAILINEIRSTRFKRTVQTITYMPHFLSWVIVSGLLIVLLSPTSGPAAGLFRLLGKEPVALLSDTRYFRSLLVISEVWKSVGWGTIIYLAAITGIDQEIYEAATVDGASRLQKIFKITLPQMADIISIMLILAVGKILDENFEQVFNMYNPAVYEVADVFETYVYRTGILNAQYSYSAAVGVFKSVVSLVLVLITNKLARLMGNEGIW